MELRHWTDRQHSRRRKPLGNWRARRHVKASRRFFLESPDGAATHHAFRQPNVFSSRDARLNHSNTNSAIRSCLVGWGFGCPAKRNGKPWRLTPGLLSVGRRSTEGVIQCISCSTCTRPALRNVNKKRNPPATKTTGTVGSQWQKAGVRPLNYSSFLERQERDVPNVSKAVAHGFVHAP